MVFFLYLLTLWITSIDFFFFFILWKFPHSGGPWPYLRLPGIWALCLGTTCLICLGGRQFTSNYRDVNASFSLFQLPWLLGRHITDLASQMYPQGFSTCSLGCREQREHPLCLWWNLHQASCRVWCFLWCWICSFSLLYLFVYLINTLYHLYIPNYILVLI